MPLQLDRHRRSWNTSLMTAHIPITCDPSDSAKQSAWASRITVNGNSPEWQLRYANKRF
jgi:hypothetical protein